jgi:hypothetical protein
VPPQQREPEFVYLPVDEAEPLIAAAYADGHLDAWTHPEQLVRRLPPAFEPEDVVKLPRWLLDGEDAEQ